MCSRVPHTPTPTLQVGYKSVLHIHTACEECEITKLICEIDPKTKEQKKAKFVKQGGICICRISVEKSICIETFQVGGEAVLSSFLFIFVVPFCGVACGRRIALPAASPICSLLHACALAAGPAIPPFHTMLLYWAHPPSAACALLPVLWPQDLAANPAMPSLTCHLPLLLVLRLQDLAALGRFTLRDEGRTIAIGKVTKLPKIH